MLKILKGHGVLLLQNCTTLLLIGMIIVAKKYAVLPTFIGSIVINIAYFIQFPKPGQQEGDKNV